MMSLDKKEIELLLLIKKHSFLNREMFESDNDFDYSCKVAKNLINKGLIQSNVSNPFTMNHTGIGSTYGLAGSFFLSDEAKMMLM